MTGNNEEKPWQLTTTALITLSVSIFGVIGVHCASLSDPHNVRWGKNAL